MPYYKQTIVLLLLLQMLTSCWARYRFAPNIWSIPSTYWNDIEDFGNNDYSNNNNNNNIKETDLLDKFLPVSYGTRDVLRRNVHLGNKQRRKKFLSEPMNSQDEYSLQGLWAMPGRR